MQIVKIYKTSENFQIYQNRNKNKKAYQTLIDNSPHYTSDDYLKLSEDDKSNVLEWVIIDEPETILDEIIRVKLIKPFDYINVTENFPEDLNEDRIDYQSLRSMADDMYYFIDRLFSYVD